MTDKLAMTHDEQEAWVREQYLKATKFLADKGLVTESVSDKESRYLIPIMAVWKINLLDKTKVWVVCGDLPTDMIVLEKQEPARNVLRHFSFKWQIQADALLKSEDQDKVAYGKLLVTKAEGLYKLYEKEEAWQEK